MPWSGSSFTRTNGQYTGATVWTSDYNAAIKILSSRHDTHDQDLAQGINACLNKNGANTPTANIGWGGYKITGLGAGAAPTDAARYGQTITAATIDPSTKVLTLARADGAVTVDLTPIVIAGDTSDFARLSVSDQSFAGNATFGRLTLRVGNGLTLAGQTGTSIKQWSVQRDNSGFYIFREGAPAVTIDNDTDTLYVGSNEVYHTGNLTPSNYPLRAATEVITGAWNFTNVNGLYANGLNCLSTLYPGENWKSSVIGYGGFGIRQAGGAQQGLELYKDATERSGFRATLGTGKVWNTGNLSVLTVAPTGGKDGDIAVVESGASKGLWTRQSGTWVKVL